MKIGRIRPVPLAVLVAGVIALGASAAGAHVEVIPDTAPKGGSEILSFSVPNEEPSANTVKVEVDLPPRSPIASVSTRPMPGWTVAVEKTKLAKPIQSDDGEVTEQAAGELAAVDGAVDHAQAGQGQGLFAHRANLSTPRPAARSRRQP